MKNKPIPLRVRITGFRRRFDWYYRNRQIGNVFTVKPYTGQLAEPGDVEIIEGEFTGFLIAAEHYETINPVIQ
ncbi:MAG: hypothetical protein INR73_28610 [Williamsia sp.]|nr:hypothetical protein [Williamsia sp.]